MIEMVILLEAALVRPPEGLNLSVIHGIRSRQTAGLSWDDGRSGLACAVDDGMALVMALLIELPHIALWLPDLVKGK